jgi:hypothetical protein
MRAAKFFEREFLMNRASHFSLAWGGPPAHKEDGFYWWAWMYGASKQPAGSLAPIARAWLKAPPLKGEGVDGRFDLMQRCYVISKGSRPLKFKLEGSTESPILNPAFVIENWGPEGASLRLNGRAVPRGKDFRFGHIRRVNRYDLVVWVKIESNAPAAVELTPRRAEAF